MFDPLLERAAPMLKDFGYKGALSVEAMYDGKDLYVIDWCARFAWPLSLMYTECLANYPEVIVGTAKGKMPQLVVTKPYTSLVTLLGTGMDRAESPWLPIRAEEGARMKVRRAVQRGGKLYAVPGGENALVALYGEGNTWQEALDSVGGQIEKVNIPGSYYEGEFLGHAGEKVKEIEEMGVKF